MLLTNSGWLAGWLAGWMAGWLDGWMAGCCWRIGRFQGIKNALEIWLQKALDVWLLGFMEGKTFVKQPFLVNAIPEDAIK